MLNKILLLSCFAVIFLASCQKENTWQKAGLNNRNTNNDQSISTNALTGTVDKTNSWYGDYEGLFNDYPDVMDDYLIKNGVAQLPYLDRQFYFSKIIYDIPSNYNISGDSISFEARVKNTKASGFSDYDVILQVNGEQHRAAVHFVADKAYTAYTNYAVGDAQYSGLTELVHYFGSFQDVKLVQKNFTTAVYINNNLVYKFKYGAKNSIGKLTSINIAFKGYGSCTKTGIKNSYTKAPILSEDFNIDGESNVVYY